MDKYLLDSSLLIEILRDRPEARAWLEDREESALYISGWTIIELMQEKQSKDEMQDVIDKLQQYTILWVDQEIHGEIFNLLIDEFHTKRTKDGSLQSSAIFDSLIYLTAKSHGMTLAAIDRDFDFGDGEVETEILDSS